MRARLLLLAAGLAAFGGSLVAGFHLDDYATFTETLPQAVRGPGPLTQLTLWLNYQVAGQEPLVYHAFNLLLHLGAVLLAYECLRRLLSPGAALVAAAIFAVHPLQAEAVNYVSARGAMLAALLCFAALLAWLEGQPWLSVIAFAAALAADERCAMFPLVLLFVRSGRGSGGQQRDSIGAMAAAWGIHPVSYGLALVSLRFLRLLVVPWGFTAYPDVREPLWMAIAMAGAIVAVAIWHGRRANAASPLTWFLAGMLLLIPNLSTNPAADSRMYLPMFAFAAAAGLLLARIPARQVAVAVVLLLTAISVSRTYVWMSEERLWREAVRRAPDRVEPKIQLAKQLRAADALEVLGRARVQAPYNPEIPAEAGKILLDEKQFDGALDELSRAVALNPKNALAFNNRGVALAALGQIPAATADFEHALTLEPDLAEARENLKRLTAR
jgi:tetratricopeptide (TPR) repeat protein